MKKFYLIPFALLIICHVALAQDIFVNDGNFYKVKSNNGNVWANMNLIGHGWSGQDYTSILVTGFTANNAELRLLANGNVGIGTTNPQSRLAVNGTITATKVKVTSSGWPDFVFKPDYKLPPLNELEVFIRKNKHLPDIPSETEVALKGRDVGEVQARLLQKIEELTLYLIALDKKVAAQEQLIREQQQLILKQRELQ